MTEARDTTTIYQVPLAYHEAGIDTQVYDYFQLGRIPAPDLSPWTRIVQCIQNPEQQLTLAIIGKYTSDSDAYKSLIEALTHAGIGLQSALSFKWVDSAIFEGEISKFYKPFVMLTALLSPGDLVNGLLRGRSKQFAWFGNNKYPFWAFALGCNWQ